MNSSADQKLLRVALGSATVAVLVVIALLVAYVLVLASQATTGQAQAQADDVSDSTEWTEGSSVLTEGRPTSVAPSGLATPPETAAPAAPAPAVPAPTCPQGGVKIVYSQIWIDGGYAYGAGVIGNQSDAPVQINGLPGAWGVDANGSNVIPVGGEWSGRVDYVYPGQTVGFRLDSAALTSEQVAALHKWVYTGDGPFLSARWLVGPECQSRPAITLEVFD